ncbi:hypothetical protein [Clavibacter tessellarius]|uniref:hypothetical protein n=1 Tax=Clavibacter tessellarius TaxID=31965 RepID=UPI003249B7C4
MRPVTGEQHHLVHAGPSGEPPRHRRAARGGDPRPDPRRRRPRRALRRGRGGPHGRRHGARAVAEPDPRRPLRASTGRPRRST